MPDSLLENNKRFYSLLWPEKSALSIWEQQPAGSLSFIKDLCIDKVLQSFMFEEASLRYAGKLFEKPCINADVIEYRLDIMRDFVENPLLADSFGKMKRTLATMEACSAEKYKNPKEIHIYTCFFEKAAAYVQFIMELRDCLEVRCQSARSAGLGMLLSHAVSIMQTDSFQQIQKDIRELSAEFESISCFNMELSYYEGFREVVVHTESLAGEIKGTESLIDRIKRNASVFLDDCESSCGIYYDVRFSKLEELILNRLRLLKPSVFNGLREFYSRYSDCGLDEVCRLKFEIEFYLKFSELISKMDKAGLPFCRPNVCKNSKKSAIRGLYDLSLALNMQEDAPNDIYETIVPNDSCFDNDGRIFVVTGPNKGGKTTYIRSLGLAQALFQAGCFVPAQEAEMSLVDRIHTHFPQEEILGIKKGRLGEETERISEILKSCTSQSLVLLNETFSSTRRIDGYFLGRELLKILMKLNCMGIYVTHFNELASEVDEINGEVPGGSKLASLVAGIEDIDGKGLTGSRTYRIHRMTPAGLGYSRDIVLKHGLSSGQLSELLKKRGFTR